eukprot:CAMPEP_0177215786 /NCGR_PEP_ID=MMETSP0367-20130122/34405_1 /TAXON_ID=447022 ORGANISM="Scrippsiella hangoei-like, Strain SHHI-4" /NCGR_SAMPLE_ID=MMETSP0367 /ASSEMBLY_ACC=CAM_ASM_000362 /LENGTH=69 /DNA_ID=CAMNT_0018665249 /DNA_START=21 /DNA_END=228 /DNA_ORIENTATION=+
MKRMVGKGGSSKGGSKIGSSMGTSGLSGSDDPDPVARCRDERVGRVFGASVSLRASIGHDHEKGLDGAH